MADVGPTRHVLRTSLVGLGVAAAVAGSVMAASAAATPSSSPVSEMAVVASARPADLLPGEQTLIVVDVANGGSSVLSDVTIAEGLSAALGLVPGSAVAVVTTRSGQRSVYTSAEAAAGPIGSLHGSSAATLVAAADAIDLAPGDRLRLTFRVVVSASVADGVTRLEASTTVAAGDAASGAVVTLTVLEDALAWAVGDEAAVAP